MDLLSICIPTYNRKERLKELLEKLCYYNKEMIKIIVIDNASTDGTDEMIKQFNNFNNILYFRNNENLGPDGNCLRIIEEGKKYSEYSLWLGDDDRVTQGFFVDIPKILIEEKPDLIMLNYKYYINSFFKRLIYSAKLKKQESTFERVIEDFKNDYIETDFRKIYEKYYNKFTFGTLVVKNNILKTEKAEKYMGTFHLYVGAILEAMADKYKKKGAVKLYITKKTYLVWGKGEKSYALDDKLNYGMGRFYALLPQVIFDIGKSRIEKQYENKEISEAKWKGFIYELERRNIVRGD